MGIWRHSEIKSIRLQKSDKVGFIKLTWFCKSGTIKKRAPYTLGNNTKPSIAFPHFL